MIILTHGNALIIIAVLEHDTKINIMFWNLIEDSVLFTTNIWVSVKLALGNWLAILRLLLLHPQMDKIRWKAILIRDVVAIAVVYK